MPGRALQVNSRQPTFEFKSESKSGRSPIPSLLVSTDVPDSGQYRRPPVADVDTGHRGRSALAEPVAGNRCGATASKVGLEQLRGQRRRWLNDTTIVLYGDNNNWFAARMLSGRFASYGHRSVGLRPMAAPPNRALRRAGHHGSQNLRADWTIPSHRDRWPEWARQHSLVDRAAPGMRPAGPA